MTRRIPIPLSVVNALKTGIQTGHTFTRLALDADDPNKIARNAANARKAYETAVRWAEKIILSPAEREEIAEQLRHLKAEVEKLEKCSKPSR